MAKVQEIKKGSEPVYPRVGENRTPITAEDINKLIGKLTASNITVPEVTAAGEADEDNELQEAGVEYDPMVLDKNFATVAQVLNNLVDIVQEAGLINEFEPGPDTDAFSDWLRCDDTPGHVFLNAADTGLLEAALGEDLVFAIDGEGPLQDQWYANEESPEGKPTNWTWAELQAANIIYLPECD